METGLWNAEKHLCPAVGFMFAGEHTHNPPLIYINKPAESNDSEEIDLARRNKLQLRPLEGEAHHL